jgi:hypothetical protein
LQFVAGDGVASLIDHALQVGIGPADHVGDGVLADLGDLPSRVAVGAGYQVG